VIDKWRYATDDNSEREIRILSKVSHPNCISLHAVYVTSRKVYIITELVSGGELLDKCGLSCGGRVGRQHGWIRAEEGRAT